MTPEVLKRAVRMTPCSGANLTVAADFRDRVFRSRSSLQFDRSLEDRIDRTAVLVGILTVGEDLVATARSTSFPDIEYESVLNGRKFERFGADSHVGRLAASPGVASARYALAMLSLGALWVSESTGYRRYISYAHEKLVPLYVAVGASDTGETVSVPGRSATYHVVVGNYRDAAQVGCGLLGMSRAESYEAIGTPRRSYAV